MLKSQQFNCSSLVVQLCDLVTTYYSTTRTILVYPTIIYIIIIIESVTIIDSDLPLNLSDDHVIKYLEESFPHVIMRTDAIMTRLPSRDKNLTQYFTGDRLVYVKGWFHPVLPETGTISGIRCKLWYTNQAIQCKRCNSDEHRTVDTNKCEAFQPVPNTAVFKSGEDPLSNLYI